MATTVVSANGAETLSSILQARDEMYQVATGFQAHGNVVEHHVVRVVYNPMCALHRQ